MLVGMGNDLGQGGALRELRDDPRREAGDQGEREQMTCRILRLSPPFEEGPRKGGLIVRRATPLSRSGVTPRPQPLSGSGDNLREET